MKLRHYRNVWRGDLPASIPMVKRYLLSMAGLVDVKLIQSRLNAICRWHRDNAHPDPGADVYVRGILRGIVKVHRFDHEPVQDARTLTFVHLEQICDALEVSRTLGQERCSHEFLSARRDLALCLLGFWAGLTGSQLSELTVANICFPDAGGLELAVQVKNKPLNRKDFSLYHLQALKKLCPVQALENWLSVAAISQGPIFRSISRWGHIGSRKLSLSGINLILQRIACAPGPTHSRISSRSLPKGFAVWASTNGWNDDDILDYLGVTLGRSVFVHLTRRPKHFGSLSMLSDQELNDRPNY